MRVVSVDLAYLDYRDFGMVVLERGRSGIEYEPVAFADNSSQTPTPERTAEFIIDRCKAVGASIALLDGPQGWKDPSNGLAHSRFCERCVNAPAKTGLPGNAKPASYLKFVAFAVEVFDAFQARGWKRYDPAAWRSDEPWVIETLPMRAWRSLGQACLPAKRRATDADIRKSLDYLIQFDVLRQSSRLLTHDQLQALVAGLGGLGVAANDPRQYEALGTKPLVISNAWREGFIVSPIRR
jgi:hypothetical protein